VRKHIKLGKLIGVPLHIDPSWLLIFVWATWSLSTSYVPERLPAANTLAHWLVGAATSLLFFFSVVLHELGHALVARAQGEPVRRITLFIFGGAAEIGAEPATAKKELALAVAGPAVSLALGALWLGIDRLAGGLPWLATIALYLSGANLALGLFNLVPGFPLDGGRVLRALIWQRTGSLQTATRWAARVGRFIAYGLMAWGIMLSLRGSLGNGLWLLLVGTFLDTSARSAQARIGLDRTLAGFTVADAMTRDCPSVPPQLSLDVFVEHYLLPQGRRCYFVGGAETPRRMLTVHQVQSVPRDRWPTTRVGEVSRPLDELRTVNPETTLREALEQMTADGVNQLPVIADGELVGMLTREGLITFIRSRAESDLHD
ncbi:MAG: site-2 protease family protein, partial [Chloroflexi bacterium]|nr:site-2 protease family protein [Chloroflexota bacterium]